MAEDTPLGAVTIPEPSSFDKWLRDDEAKNLDPILHPQPAPTAADATKVPGSPEEHKVEEAPEVPEAPPVPQTVETAPNAEIAPETPPVEAAPEAEEEPPPGTPEQKVKKYPSWKDVRELQNEIKQERALRLQSEQSRDARDGRVAELEMEIARMKGMIEGRAPAPEAELIEPDPLTKVEREIEAMKQQQAQQLQAQQRSQMDMTIRNHEAEFERRPEGKNYRAALDYLVKNEVAEWTASGAIDEAAAYIRQNAAAEVRNRAIQSGKSETDAARDMAIQAGLWQRRDVLTKSAIAQGKNVAEVVWTMAQNRGFKAIEAAPPPPPPAKEEPVVRDVKAIKEAGASLSAMNTSKPPPPKQGPKSRSELLEMDVNERAAYIEDMDKTQGPDWLRNMR